MLGRPMLAAKYDPAAQRFPCLASPKLDGVRALTFEGHFYSRTLKLLPNSYAQSLASSLPSYLDGELIVGSPTAKDCLQRTVSGVMSQGGTPDITYHVFDTQSKEPFDKRFASLPESVLRVPQTIITADEELQIYYADALSLGFEGVILRDPLSPYKNGRSTLKQGYLIKMKPLADCEGRIIGFTELMRNENPKEISELGLTKRAHLQENLTPSGTLGALEVRCINGPYQGTTVEVGTGFTAAQRQEIWDSRVSLLGSIITFSYFPYGIKDRPRHPVFRWFRPSGC